MVQMQQKDCGSQTPEGVPPPSPHNCVGLIKIWGLAFYNKQVGLGNATVFDRLIFHFCDTYRS